MFIAVLALDEARQRGHRWDLVCCVTESESMIEDEKSHHPVQPHDEPAPSVLPREDSDDLVQHFLRTWWAPTLLYSPALKLSIVVLFLGFGGLCAWMYTQVGLGFDLMDLTPDQSYARDFLESIKSMMGGALNGRLDVYLVYSHEDFHTAETQNAMNTFNTQVRAAPETYDVVEWMQTFYAYANVTQPQFMQGGVFVPGSAAAFGATMKSFLNYTCPSTATAGCSPGADPNSSKL